MHQHTSVMTPMRFIACLPLALLLLACGSVGETEPVSEASSAAAGAPTASAGPRVVVTTDIWGDVVGQILACGGGTVEVLMPSGADPHDFAPSSAQLAGLQDAQLVIANGLGLESGMTDALLGVTADGGNVWEIAPLLDPQPFQADHGDGHGDEHGDGHGDEHGDKHGDEHGSLDPHVWFDLKRMATAVTLIGAELDSLADGRGRYADCATEIADSFTNEDAQIRELLGSIPEQRRVLITDHDALGYFATAYDFEVAGTVIPAGTTLAEPSGRDIAELAQTVTRLGVPAIFTNIAQPQDLAQAVAAEAGTEVQVIDLFVEGLGEPGSGADTYLGLMQANAKRIVEGLGGVTSQ
jgi:zinc/manganese transport system substrate-binding protein